MSSVEINTANGVNIQALLEARQALTEMPVAAQFKWRASSEWVSGTHTRSSVEKFFGLGEEQSHKTTFTYDTDHPEIFASEDIGSTPVEFVLVGLSGCIGAGIATVAANREIKLNSVKTTVEADMDLAGILGIDSEVRNGFSNIRIKYEIDADASEEDIRAIVAQSQKRSAVFDIVTNPTEVEVEVRKA
jgi:uncharacterized OsmC-like protein